MRCRLLVGRLSRQQGLLINGFYVLRESLSNFKKFAEGLIANVEKGEESKDKGSFQLPEMYGGGAGQAAAAGAKGGAKGAPAKAPPAKPGAKGGAADNAEELSAAEEEARRAAEKAEADEARLVAEAMARRQHPHMLLWMKTKLEIIDILLA